MTYFGDFAAGATVRIPWNTNAADGSSITRTTDGTLRVYKNAVTTERSSASGITDAEDHDGHAGTHLVSIDLSDNTDVGFYATGNEYFVKFTGMDIDGLTVNAVVGSFSIQNRYSAGVAPTAAAIADAVWDEATAGHTTSGTFGEQCKTDIDAILDDTGTAGVIVASIAAGAITASAIAPDAIGASELAASAAEEIADAVMVRASSNWEGSAADKSLGTAVMKLTHAVESSAGTLTVFRSDGTTPHITQTETTDAAALPVTELTGAS